MNEWFQQLKSPTAEGLRSLRANKLADGSVELIVEESTKKTLGEKWHTRTAVIVLKPEQFAELISTGR